jgi:hypothetical protein
MKNIWIDKHIGDGVRNYAHFHGEPGEIRKVWLQRQEKPYQNRRSLTCYPQEPLH